MRGENGSSPIGLVSFVTELKLCCTVNRVLGLSGMISPPISSPTTPKMSEIVVHLGNFLSP